MYLYFTIGVMAVSALPCFRKSRCRAKIWGAFICLAVMLLNPDLTSSGFFVRLVSSFHLGEYIWCANFHPSSLTFDSFLLNNSIPYLFCMIAAVLEHMSEVRLCFMVQCCGAVLSIIGFTIRTMALWSAGHNFTHQLATYKTEDHHLLTCGIYSFMRHPGYAGWLAWVVGGQLLLGNPVCSIYFAIISWMFFSERINAEDATLLEFFGSEFEIYRRRTHSGIPGIQ